MKKITILSFTTFLLFACTNKPKDQLEKDLKINEHLKEAVTVTDDNVSAFSGAGLDSSELNANLLRYTYKGKPLKYTITFSKEELEYMIANCDSNGFALAVCRMNNPELYLKRHNMDTKVDEFSKKILKDACYLIEDVIPLDIDHNKIIIPNANINPKEVGKLCPPPLGCM